MSKKEEDARLMRKSLEDNARERNTYIKMAMEICPTQIGRPTKRY